MSDDKAASSVSWPEWLTPEKRHRLDQRVMELLGDDWGGDSVPPTSTRKIYIREGDITRVFSMHNDAFEVGVGYPDKWHVFMPIKTARMFAWWVLKTWVADWFGLRRALWYRALHHKVRGSWRPTKRHPPSEIRLSSHAEWWADRHSSAPDITDCSGSA